MSKTSVFKRGLTAFMAMLLCLSSFIGLGTTTAYAAGEQAEVYMISFPRDGDANYGGDWGHPNLHYMNGWTSGSSNKTTIRAMGSYTGIACYVETWFDVDRKFSTIRCAKPFNCEKTYLTVSSAGSHPNGSNY